MVLDLTSLFVGRKKRKPQALPQRLGIYLGKTSDERPVFWPEVTRERSASALVLASSGSGKSAILAHILSEEIIRERARDPLLWQSQVIIDPKGDLGVLVVSALAAKAPELLARVNWLRPFVGGFPFNVKHLERGRTPDDLLSLMLAQMIGSVSTSTGMVRDLGVGARQIDVLQNFILAANAVPDGNILIALDALTMKDGPVRLAALTTSERARGFLLGNRPSDELLASSASRLRTALASSEVLEQIVAAPTCIQWSDLTAPGAITILDLSEQLGGQTVQAAYANIFFKPLLEWMNSRPSPWPHQHTRVVVDEAHIVVPALSDGVAEYTISTGRSRGISLVVCLQASSTIRKTGESVWQSILANTPQRLVGRINPVDAEELARNEGGELNGEVVHTRRARIAAQLASLRDREFFFTAPGVSQRFHAVELEMKEWEEAAQREAATITGLKEKFTLPKNMPRRRMLSDDAPVGPTRPPTASAPTASAKAEAPPAPRSRRSKWG